MRAMKLQDCASLYFGQFSLSAFAVNMDKAGVEQVIPAFFLGLGSLLGRSSAGELAALQNGWFDSQTCVKLSHLIAVFGPRGAVIVPKHIPLAFAGWQALHVLVNEMRGRRATSLPELKDCLGKAFF